MYVQSRAGANCDCSNDLTQLVRSFENYIAANQANAASYCCLSTDPTLNETELAQDAFAQLTDERIVGKDLAKEARKLLKDKGTPLEAFRALQDLALKGDKTALKILKGYEAVREAAQSGDWDGMDAGNKSLAILSALDRAGLVDGDVGKALAAMNRGQLVLRDVIDYAQTSGASREEVVQYAANALAGSGLLPKDAEKAIDIYNVANQIADGIDPNASIEENVSFAADTLATSGVLPKEFGTAVAAIDAGIDLGKAIDNTIDGQPGGSTHIALAARALGMSGILGKDVSNVLAKGGQVYDTAKSVLSLIESPSLLSGVGVIGALGHLIGGKELGTVADFASLGLAFAAGGVPGIVLAAINVIDDVFGIDIVGGIAKGIGKAVDAVGDAVKGVGKAIGGAVKAVGHFLGGLF